jgi:hypothetical protein
MAVDKKTCITDENAELQRLRQEIKADRNKVSMLEKRLRGQTASYIITVLVLVGAFVWKDLLEHVINKYLKFSESQLSHKFTMAILFTLISCIVIFYVVKFIERNGEDHVEEEDTIDNFEKLHGKM